MAGRSSPINIATQSRNAPASPRHQQVSNLTYALQSTTGNELRPSSAMNTSNGTKQYSNGRYDSSGAMSGLGPNYGSGAQPISMSNSNRGQPRRESIASSLAGGMSWGGVSVGSWIRDDVMQGTSPFPYKSPSFHSSSYLPKLEANFMKDFFCCGLTLPSLHELLQHYEESHAQNAQPSLSHQHMQMSTRVPDTKAAMAANTAASVQQQAQHLQGRQQPQQPQQEQQQQQQRQPTTSSAQVNMTHQSVNNLGIPRSNQQHPQYKVGEFARTPLQPVQDVDDVDDMEMDDVSGNDYSDFNLIPQQAQLPLPNRGQMAARSQFGQPPVAPLDLNGLNFTNPLQAHQGLRNSQPTTPVTGNRFAYQNNPTVSSVNTPTLSTYPTQQQYRNTPDSSAPGTPAELDTDFLGNVNNMSMNQQLMQDSQQLYASYAYGNGNEMLELCIDEPAKRLFSSGGYADNKNPPNPSKLGSAQYGPNSEIARRIRERQSNVGLADTTLGLHGEEPKPFRCPVIGCEKAYKNQNGLKYHKHHGHNSQQLHENTDGTFSIVDPLTKTPYPGTLGMEKEKPYKCEVCGKRYKNLNGLKYHKSHSTPCNPELRSQPTNIHHINANVAGAGMPGIGEEMEL